MDVQLISTYFTLKDKSQQSIMTWLSGLSFDVRRRLIESLSDAGYTEEAREVAEDFD